MKTEKLWEILYNADGTEGRGPMVNLGYVRDKKTAESIVDDPRYRTYCVMGVQSPGGQKYCIQEKNIIVADSAEEFWQAIEEDKRRKALSKLTAEERKLLGLT